MTDKKSSIRVGIVLTYIRLAIYIVLALFYPPFLLQVVGKVNYGLYQFAGSALSFVLLASFGIENTYVRFSTLARAKDGETGLAKTNGFYLIVFGGISVVEILIGISIAFLYRAGIFTISDASVGSNETVFWLLLITAISISADFFMSLFSWFTYFKSRFAFMQITLLVSHVLTIGFSCLALLLGGGIVWVAIVAAIVQLSFDLLDVLYCFFNLKMKIKIPSRQEFWVQARQVIVFSFFLFLGVVASQINANLGKTVLESLGNNTMVTVFSYGIQFYSYEALISIAISDNFTPRINDLVVKRKDEEVSSLFFISSKIQMIVLFCIVGGFAACGLDFISVWLKNKGDLSAENYLQIFLLGLGFLLLWIVPLSETVGLEIQKANNKHKFLAVFNFSVSLLSVLITVLSVWLLPEDIKVYGPLIGMAVAVISGMVIASNIYYKKELHLPVGDLFGFFGILLGITLLAWVVPFGLFGYLVHLPDWVSGYYLVLIKGLTFLAIFVPFAVFLLRKEIRLWKANRLK